MSDEEGPVPVDAEGYFSKRRVILFSVPGAFTPTCSNSHLPGFIQYYDKFVQLGVDAIACTAVNDTFVMHAWGLATGADKIDMLADGNGNFVHSLGLQMDATAYEMGHRGQRFALVADDGVISHLMIESPGDFRLSSAQHVFSVLDQ